jgi:phytoene synthase
MVHDTIYSIFKTGSKTYFYSSIFFPGKMKEDVFILYAFVRKADNFVDIIPQQKKDYLAFKKIYEEALKGKITGDIVIDSFVDLVKRKNFEKKHVNAFLKSMDLDLYKAKYETMEDLKVYLYGSAEVIGLMMAKIINLPKQAYPSAMYLGRAMQYINFIRDISEDLKLGRTYFPQEELKKFNLKSLEYKYASKHPRRFVKFLRAQLDIYSKWQKKAEEGFCFIPRRFLIPIKTAADMYNWTGAQIYMNPFIVYESKIKPSIPRVVYGVFNNTVKRLCERQKIKF